MLLLLLMLLFSRCSWLSGWLGSIVHVVSANYTQLYKMNHIYHSPPLIFMTFCIQPI